MFHLSRKEVLFVQRNAKQHASTLEFLIKTFFKRHKSLVCYDASLCSEEDDYCMPYWSHLSIFDITAVIRECQLIRVYLTLCNGVMQIEKCTMGLYDHLSTSHVYSVKCCTSVNKIHTNSPFDTNIGIHPVSVWCIQGSIIKNPRD